MNSYEMAIIGEIVGMCRDTNKIESIAVNTVSQEIDSYDLLHPCLATNDKTPFFDGHIFVYKEPKQKNENWKGRIPIQIKGRECARFSNDNKCSFLIKKSELDAFWKECGILFFFLNGNMNFFATGTLDNNSYQFLLYHQCGIYCKKRKLRWRCGHGIHS